ncbi:hypothetical protein BA190_10220 [Labrys sp. WJW]|uniref:hypothetical protein n=1 Tax=Labrys sp. WJW TaxID=1737983 RepID=UPI00083394DA|nr:hypothetical protein [Labrys sp. WJW]OCC05269.1 hypothetical protein BA190_10220 [Labrys sp. WJW]
MSLIDQIGALATRIAQEIKGLGSVLPTGGALVRRDPAGSAQVAALQAQLIYSPATRPAYVQQPIFIRSTTPDGALDGAKTFYFTVLVLTAEGQYWTEPEVAVAMGGNNTVEWQTQIYDASKIQGIITFRSETPGNYLGPGAGAVDQNVSGPQAGTAWIFVDKGAAPLLAMNPPAATTVPFQLHANGLDHTGTISAKDMVVTAPVPSDADGNQLVPAVWINGKVAPATKGALQVDFDGNGAALPANLLKTIKLNFPGRITGWSAWGKPVAGETSGSATFAVWRKAFADGEPTAADKMSGAGPSISAATQNTGTDLSDWTGATFGENDRVTIALTSVSNFEKLSVSFSLLKAAA